MNKQNIWFWEMQEWIKEWKLWWVLTSVDVYDCDPKIIRCRDSIKKYVIELCDLIDMKRFWDTEVVHFWEDEKVAWYSMTQLIETSLISGHFANATNASYLDIFSCKEYDPNVVWEFSQDFFKWKYHKKKVTPRFMK